MQVIRRSIERVLAERLQEERPLMQVLVGARQVGKTTAIRGALGGRGVYRSADSPLPLGAAVLEQWWQEAEEVSDRVLAVDEIQKIKGWAETLKRLWDTRPGLKVVVSGSASLLVEKGLAESLAGRFELIRAEHWGFDEVVEAFGLSVEDYVQFGGYPGAMRFLPDVERWSAYVRDSIVEPVLGRDLLQLHPVDSPALLRQLFGIAAALPAQTISLHKMQGELQGQRGSLTTLSSYLRLLGEAFLVSAVRRFNPQEHIVRASIPKLVVHDNGLLRAFERPVTVAVPPTRLGRYFENVVGARFLEAGWETYYWRHRDLEVDFVVRGPGGENWAVEVKTGAATEGELRGLRAFCGQHPQFEPCLVRLRKSPPVPGIRELSVTEVLSLHRGRHQIENPAEGRRVL